MLTIWGRANSTNVQKVLWLCAELGMDYRRIDAGGPFGGTDTPDYRAMNPNGLVPTIDHDGFVLWESHAILRYLASIDPARRFYPREPQAATRIDQWMDWQVIALAWQLRTLFLQANRPADAPAGEGAAAARKTVEASLALLDHHLQGAAYVAGDGFTIADIPLGISVHRWQRMKGDLSSLPALAAWHERVTQRAGVPKILGV
jgi:glutathione S-transferase